MRLAAILILLFAFGTRRAPAADMPALLRAHDWPAAAAYAAAAADPVAVPLVTWLRLLAKPAAPVAADPAEIDRFITAHSDWPLQNLLGASYDEAVAANRDDPAASAACAHRRPTRAPALLRCADALARTGADPATFAKTAWLTGIADAPTEIAVMHRWTAIITIDDQRARFDRLAWTDKGQPGGPLARQALRLDPAARQIAEIRLALRRDEPGAAMLYAALPDAAKTEPGLVLDLLRWHRRTGHEIDAARLWTERGQAAETTAPAERQRLFWDERNILARALLQKRDDAHYANTAAYGLAALPTPQAPARAEADFLAGWIALRRLNQPDVAANHFRALCADAASAIAQARGHYWLARAQAAAGQNPDAEYRQAAAWPTTYYGQLAALAAGGTIATLADTIRAVNDPAWDEARALDVTGSEFGRAAALLAAWGEKRRAKAFLQTLEDGAEPQARAIVARYATELGLPDAAVAAARQAGARGVMLPSSGWPEAADPPADQVERAALLGLIRQESSFDPDAGSPAGAQGLMQLMPATAADIARRLHDSAPALSDPVVNMRLGTAYLAGLLDRFHALPPALAGYNAGPGRTREWLASFGDPAAGTIDPIDWIELIPYGETRDYVQRVVENVMIYRARSRAGSDLPHPVLQWATNRA